MKKVTTGLASVLAAGFLLLSTGASAGMGGGGMGSGMGSGYGSHYPNGGNNGSAGNGSTRDYGYGMGPGMMGGGSGMGQGMMGPGYSDGSTRRYDNGPQQQLEQPLDRTQARSIVEKYLRSTGNPNLKMGDLKDEGRYFEADIVTRDNSLVDKLLVDKNTGEMRSAY